MIMSSSPLLRSLLLRSSTTTSSGGLRSSTFHSHSVWFHLCQQPQRHQFQFQSHQLQQLRSKHTVRIILLSDLPSGKAYKGDVIHIAAGYMRNMLYPNKMALYAIPQNFERLGRKDPDAETAEERRQRLERLAMDDSNENLKAANLLTKYLKGKMVKIYRKVDEAGVVNPGVVVGENIRQKLSRQLKIDLTDEIIHILPDPLLEEHSDEKVMEMMAAIPSDVECTVQLKKLGFFYAKLTLAGGFVVPLKFQVIKKVY